MTLEVLFELQRHPHIQSKVLPNSFAHQNLTLFFFPCIQWSWTICHFWLKSHTLEFVLTHSQYPIRVNQLSSWLYLVFNHGICHDDIQSYKQKCCGGHKMLLLSEKVEPSTIYIPSILVSQNFLKLLRTEATIGGISCSPTKFSNLVTYSSNALFLIQYHVEILAIVLWFMHW